MDRMPRSYCGPWAYLDSAHARSYPDEATGGGDLGPEQDYPMDEFDKQLLADQQGEHIPIRYSLPSNLRCAVDYNSDRRNLRDDLVDVRNLPNSSSSPAFPVSSPTTSALQNRSRVSQRSKQQAPNFRQSISETPRSGVMQAQPRHYGTHTRQPVTKLNLPHARPVIQGIPSVPTYQLPDHLSSIFNFELFNAVQSKCFSAAFETDDNIVLSAPTGSGKTVILELAICRLLASSKTQDFKVIYQAPTKSLCGERHRDWTAKFNTLGLQCAELTGDVEFAQLKAVKSAHIIITTPEKWDSVTRKWRDNAKLMQMIKLFLVDEVHILNETRGATLEAVVSRMKSAGSGVRFVALSATVPNSEDIATWLGRSPTSQHLPAYREVFDEAFRPVKLDKHVVGYSGGQNEFALDSTLTKEIPAIVARYGKEKPVMIFCVTKNSAIKTANVLADLWSSTATEFRFWKGPTKQIRVMHQELQKVISAGVAFHHGALDAADRRAVEYGFLQGDINVICSTSTLAVGVNLPCYLVILKGTSCWSDSGLQEYSSLDVMQMLGRAGRPQYETSACAVILTQSEKVHRYENMVSGQETLESSLHENLIEHLNAEIGIGTIHDRTSAKKWLASTFLNVRLRQNPGYYRLQGQATTNDVDQLLEQISDRDLKLLETAELIEQHNGFRCTEYGNAMARYYIQYETMLGFLKLSEKPRISEILSVLAQAHEFYDLKLRSGEKALYKDLNKANDIRYPINVDIALPFHKTSLIIQAQLGSVVLDKAKVKYAGQFKQDSLMVMSHCNRLIRCIIDILISRQDATAVRNSLELCRSMAAGVWDNTPMQLKQIESIGDVTARKLASAGINSIDALLSTESHRIEVVLGKSQPFGNTLLNKAAKFPNLRVSVREIDRTRKTASKGIELKLKCEIGYLNESLPLYFNRKGVCLCFLCETSNGKLVDFRRFSAHRLQNGEPIFLTVLLDKPCNYINCHVMCDQIAGTHRYAELKLDLPTAWFPSTRHGDEVATTVDRNHLIPLKQSDTFDDAGLVDDDFLVAEFNVDDVDVVEGNIDDILAAQDKGETTAKGLKRKAPPISTHEFHSALSKDYRKSTQLANGNWTCQHTCNKEGKECKHQCCKEGVKRPKKHAKTPSMASTFGSTIKDAFTKSPNNAKSSNRSTIHDIDEVLQDNASYCNLPDIYSVTPTKSTICPRASTTIQSTESQLIDDSHIVDIDDFDPDELPSVNALVLNCVDSKPENSTRPHWSSVESDYESAYNVDNLDIDSTECDWVMPNDAENDGQDSATSHSMTLDYSKGSNWNPTSPTKAKHTLKTTGPVIKESLLVSPEKNASDDALDYFEGVDDASLIALAKVIHPSESAARKTVFTQTATCVQAEGLVERVPELPEVDFLDRATAKMETEQERKQRLHEENQKEKWARLPAKMYEDYGAYVDLI